MRELSLFILDVAQNSIDACATKIQIIINEDYNSDLLSIEMIDNGHGMTDVALARVTDPFYTTKYNKKGGMGIALLKHATERTNGDFLIESEPHVGTHLKASFKLSHPDMMPLGAIADTVVSITSGRPLLELEFRHTIGDETYSLLTSEIYNKMNSDSIETILYIKNYIKDNVKRLTRKNNNEL